MARLPYVDYEGAPGETQRLYRFIEGTIGRVSNFMKLMGHVPWLLRWTFPLGLAAQRGGFGLLDARTKNLAIVKASLANQCHY